MVLRLVAVLAVFTVFWVPARSERFVRVPFEPPPFESKFVADEFIVVFDSESRKKISVRSDSYGRPTANIYSLQRILESHSVSALRRQFPTAPPDHRGSRLPDLTGHYKVMLAPGADIDGAIAAFEADPNVDHVEKIGIHPVYSTPNDPEFDDALPTWPFDQWNFWSPYGIAADLAWDIETGDPRVVIGILDTGVRYFHLDLGGNAPPWGPNNPYAGGNIWVNKGDIPGNGIDDDGNGFVDDTVGWDFVRSTEDPLLNCADQDCGGADNDPDDGHGHGTHVAGIVAAITNNARMVAGVAGGFSDGTTAATGNGVKILPLRIGWRVEYLGWFFGVVRMDWAAEAMVYTALQVQRGLNVTAVNCSWSSSNTGGLSVALDYLLAHDVMVVHAAGNNNSDIPDFLGGKPAVMNVAATNTIGQGASFSNYGPWVDVAAPGYAIVSTFRNPEDPDPNAHYLGILSGTSMSAPHVSGIAGLLESCLPALSGPDKSQLIVNNTKPYTDTRYLGTGIVNARKALDAAGCGPPCDITAEFFGWPTSGCAPLTVTFVDLSTGTNNNSWSWNFGDGSTSSERNPIHTYAAAGSYEVSLLVRNGSCLHAESKTRYVTVGSPPEAAFAGSPTSGGAPLIVNFTDLSTNEPTSWLWDFGDGGTSTTQHPTHVYELPGTYTVSLTVGRSCGSRTETKVNYITVTSPPPGNVMFVSNIQVSRIRLDHGVRRGVAVVTIRSDQGNAVANATVRGKFTGKTTESAQTSVTNTAGQATFYSSLAKGGSGAWCFEVVQVTHATLSYNPDLNVVTRSCEVSTALALGWDSELNDGSGRKAQCRVYPNPFNPTTSVVIDLPEAGDVRIVIYDVSGRAVRRLTDGYFEAGTHRVPFDSTDDGGRPLATGIYFYRFATRTHIETGRMILLK